MSPQARVRLNLVMAFVVLIAITSLNIVYTSHEQHKSDQRWCDLIVSLDDRYRAIKDPQGATAEFAQQMAELRAGLRCEARKPLPPPLPSQSTN